jgi:hypothetical protein
MSLISAGSISLDSAFKYPFSSVGMKVCLNTSVEFMKLFVNFHSPPLCKMEARLLNKRALKNRLYIIAVCIKFLAAGQPGAYSYCLSQDVKLKVQTGLQQDLGFLNSVSSLFCCISVFLRKLWTICQHHNECCLTSFGFNVHARIGVYNNK